jgi:hypothetical protein
MGALRARGKLWTIVDRSAITHESNICFNLTLHDDLNGVLKNLRYMIDVPKKCGVVALDSDLSDQPDSQECSCVHVAQRCVPFPLL